MELIPKEHQLHCRERPPYGSLQSPLRTLGTEAGKPSDTPTFSTGRRSAPVLCHPFHWAPERARLCQTEARHPEVVGLCP